MLLNSIGSDKKSGQEIREYFLMDDVIDDLIRSAMSCERAAKHFETDEIEDIRKRVVEATSSVDQAWSGSFIGYQALPRKSSSTLIAVLPPG